MVFNKKYDQALGARGHVAKIVFTIGDRSPPRRVEQIQAGQLDFQTSNLGTADIIKLSSNAALAGQVHVSPRPSLTYIFLNNEVPPLNNLDVRKAINYAVNRTEILKQWGGPLAGSPSDQIIPPGQSDYKQYTIYPNTPNLSDGEEAHAANPGVKTPVTLVLRTQNDTPGFIHMAEVIQSNLKPIGINVQIVGSPNSVNSSLHRQLQGQGPDGDRAVVAGLPGRRGHHQYRPRPGDPGRAGEHGPVVRPVLRRALQQGAWPCRARPRQAAYEALDKQIMSQQAPYAPLFNPKWYDFVSARLGGYVYSEAMDAINYNTLYIK